MINFVVAINCATDILTCKYFPRITPYEPLTAGRSCRNSKTMFKRRATSRLAVSDITTTLVNKYI